MALPTSLPCGRIARPVHYRQYLDSIRKRNVVKHVAEFLQPRCPNILPDPAIHFRHEFDALEHLANLDNKLAAQPNSRPFQIIVSLENVVFGFGSKNRWQAHEPPSSGPTTSRQGLPWPGRASACARRLASSATCQAGTSSGATWSGKLSQICSISSRRSQ